MSGMAVSILCWPCFWLPGAPGWVSAVTNLRIEATSPHQAVDSGREALGSGWRYPWYDARNDSLRRLSTRRWSWWPDWNPPNLSFAWHEWLFWALVVLLLVLVTYFLVRAYLAREGRAAIKTAPLSRGGPAADLARIEALPFDVAAERLSLLEAARRAYAAGDYRQAAVYLFSHQLVELDKRHLIRLARGKTNRQYLRELGTYAHLRALIEQTMVLFEEVFFGDRAISRPRFENCWFRLPEFDQILSQVTP